MKSNRYFKWLWLASVILLIGQSLIGYGELPDRMASHFNAAGEPDGFSSKQEFFLLWYFVIVIVNIWVPIVPVSVRKLPTSLLSIPNKEYWLADESRRKRMINIVTDVLCAILFVTNVILMLAFKYTVDVNRGDPPPFSLTWITVLVVLGLLIGVIYPFYALRVSRKDIDG